MGAGVWLDGYAKGGAWMCNNTTPVPANSAAARHSDRSTGSNATTAYYASPSLCLPIFPPSLCFPIRPSIHPFPSSSFVSFPLGLCFSLVASSLFNPPPRFPSISFRLEHPCHLHACTWYVTVSWTRRDERLKEEEERCFLEGCGR